MLEASLFRNIFCKSETLFHTGKEGSANYFALNSIPINIFI